ncbi:MAG: polyprotein (domains: capsid, helicase, peptidase, RdRP) [Plant associated sequivirus 2]|nr:MAG: polyprotein (domains: capsid, helicase, peptidase, RdRP) [Plant associated sequivirus 2]
MSTSSKNTQNVDLSDPTAVAIAAGQGQFAALEEAALCSYNFVDVSELENEPGASSKTLSGKIKQRAAALLGVSRAYKETEQVLSTERCRFKEISEHEEIIATTFEPLRDLQGPKRQDKGKDDTTLAKHRAKFNYMAIDALRISISSLLHQGDERECIMYVCDRRIEDPFLGALALIGFPLRGMSTHVYKTGRIVCFSKHEAIAPEHIQLFVYIKGPKLLKKDNAPFALNMKTSFIFGNNAENLLKHDTSMDTDGNLVAFMTQNQDIFGWLEAAQGSGYKPLSHSTNQGIHLSRSGLMRAWANPKGSISQRMGPPMIQRDDTDLEHDVSDFGTARAKPLRDDCNSLRIGIARSGITTTELDKEIHPVTHFVQDSEIEPVKAKLEAFMTKPDVGSTIDAYEKQFTRPIYVNTVEWKSTNAPGEEILALESPGDFMSTHALFGQFVKRAFCFKADFEFNVMISGNEAYSGAIKVCVDHMRRLYEADGNDNLVYHSMPGETMHASDTNGISFVVPFNSIHNMISAHDLSAHNTLGRISFRVLARLAHAIQTAPKMHVTVQVYVKHLEAKHAMWKAMEVAFPTSQGTPLPSAVGQRFGREGFTNSSLGPSEINAIINQKALIGTASVTKETGLRVMIATFAIHPMSSRLESGILKMSQLAAICAMYSYWRGSLVVHFEMTCSSSTRGKILFSVTPKGGAEIRGAEALHLGMGAEFDLGTAISRRFEVPFISTDNWESLGDRGLMGAFEGVWDCPVGRVFVLHPITSISDATPSVDIRCYLSPGRDFEVRGFRHIGLRTSLRPLSFGGAQVASLHQGAQFTLMGSVDIDSTSESCTLQIPSAPWYAKDEIDYTLLQNPLHWMSRFFTFWKGDISFRIVVKESDALAENWQAPITMWHNPCATMETCKLVVRKDITLSKEGLPAEKISLKQQNAMEITAHDDERYNWRLCKLHDTKQITEESSSTSQYTGHPPLSSHTGAVFVKFPKGGFKAKVKVYSKPEANFRYHLCGGVPSLKLDNLRPFIHPFYTTKLPTMAIKGEKLIVGRAQGLSVRSFVSGIIHSAPPSLGAAPSEKEALIHEEVEETFEVATDSLLTKAQRKLKELFTRVTTHIKNSICSVFSNLTSGMLGSLFQAMLDRAMSVFKDIFGKIADILYDLMHSPATYLVLALSFTAIACYSALKFAQHTIPTSMGYFKTILIAASVGLCAVYWPQALGTLVAKFELFTEALSAYCGEIHEYFFPTYQESDTSVPSASANSYTSSEHGTEDLNVGKGQGKNFLFELAGIAAYVQICVTICELMGCDIKDTFKPRNLEKNMRSVSGISQGIKTLAEFKDYLYRIIMGSIMPSSAYVTISQEVGFDIREWFDDVERLTLHENRYTDLNNPDKIREIRIAYSRGLDVMGILSTVEMVHLSRMCERTFKLAKELLDETHRVKGVSGVRLDPFHLSLFGKPGVGKSFIMGRLLEDSLDLMGEPRADRSYSKTPNEEYWSGYYGQTAVKCDDLGQDLSKGFSPTYNQIIQMKTNNPFIVPMADLANKGRTFTSKYIFSTTNVDDCGTKHGLADPGAFMRRRDILAKVTSEGQMIHGMVDHLRFTILNPLHPSERDLRYPENMSYADFLCVSVFEMTQYFQKQEKVLETLRGKQIGNLKPSATISQILGTLDAELAEEIVQDMEDIFHDADEVPLLTRNQEVTKDDIDEVLANGRAQASSFSSFKYDFDGKPYASPYVQLFKKQAVAFAKQKKKAISDELVHEFGVRLTMGEFEAINPGNLQHYKGFSEGSLFKEFFDFVFLERLQFIGEEEFLVHFPTLTGCLIRRLVKATTFISDENGERMELNNDYDRLALEALSYPEKTAYHLIIAGIRAKKLKMVTWRSKLGDWFKGVKEACAEILQSLNPLVKFLIVLATSCGAIFLAFKGVSSVMSSALSVFKTFSEEKEFVQMSLGVLTARGRKGKKRPSFGSGDELTTRVERMISRSALATGVAQGGRTCDEVQQLLLSRMGFISNTAAGKGMVAINIGNGCLLCPLHIFEDAMEDDMMEFLWHGEKYFFVFTKDKVTQVGELDLCIIDTHSVPKRDMVLSIFMDEKELEAFSDIKCSFVSGPYNITSGSHIEDQLVALRIKQFKYMVGEQLFLSVQGWSVKHATFDGQCGSVLVSEDETVNGKVFGCLVAGTMNMKGEKVATYVPLSKQMLLKALGAKAELKVGTAKSSICGIHIDPDLNVALGLSEKFLDEERGKCGVYEPCTKMGAIHVVGCIAQEANIRCATKTSIIPSIIQHQLPRKPLTEPAILSESDPRLGNKRFDPLLDGIKKYEHQARPFHQAWRGPILETFKSDMEDWDTDLVREGFETTEPDLDVIINGIDGAEYYEGINMSTSEGYPLILTRPDDADGKMYLFDQIQDSDKYVIKSEQLRKNYEAYGIAFQEGHPVPLICIESPKDERRALKKIYGEPKTRLFSILPVEFNMHARRLYLDFNVLTMANRHKHGIMVGINPHSREWTEMAISLASFSPLGFNGDFANFDGMFHPDSFAMVGELATHFYKGFNATERKTLTDSLTNRLSLVKGAVLSIGGGGPSGFPMTVIFNSYINLFYLMSAWSHLAMDNGRHDIQHPSFFKKFVRACVYGDDNIVSIKEEVISWYNLCTVSDFLKKAFGVTMTDGEKNEAHLAKPYGKILEFDFLKRGFVPDSQIPSLFHAPLNRVSIEEQVYWIRKGGDADALLQANVENALYEASHHGRDYFNELKDTIKEAYGKIGKTSVLPTFLMCRQRWLSNDLGEVATNSTPSRASKIVATARNSFVSPVVRPYSEACIKDLVFITTKDSLGGNRVQGPLQELIRGFYIGSNSEVFSKYSQSHFGLILDNTLSLGQTKYGRKHGVSSLQKPSFTFLSESVPILSTAWPCVIVSVDIHGGFLALVSGLLLLHATKFISTNELCKTTRRHLGRQGDTVLKHYFQFLDSKEGEKIREIQTTLNLAGKRDLEGFSARAMFRKGDTLFGDETTLPRLLKNDNSSPRSSCDSYVSDEILNEEDFDVDIVN